MCPIINAWKGKFQSYRRRASKWWVTDTSDIFAFPSVHPLCDWKIRPTLKSRFVLICVVLVYMISFREVKRRSTRISVLKGGSCFVLSCIEEQIHEEIISHNILMVRVTTASFQHSNKVTMLFKTVKSIVRSIYSNLTMT